MSSIFIRKYKDSDYDEVLNISYKTGYMGNDLHGTGKFDDVKLFGYLFCVYYLNYEKDNCFVAIDKDENSKVVGYIIGTLNTKKQQKAFLRKMLLKISKRLIYTLFKYPETFKNIRCIIRNRAWKLIPNDFYTKYPAHFHINILGTYQDKGIGHSLLVQFEDHVKKKGIYGIHLKTSNKNYRANKFYIKNGYNTFLECNDNFWDGIEDYMTIIFTKNLN